MDNKVDKIEQILGLLALPIRDCISQKKISFDALQEIRIRINRPLFLKYDGKELKFPYLVTQNDLAETMEYIANYSLYAYEHELGQGFITIAGGHRVGIAGKVIVENHKVKNFQYISSINIRVCHQITGCADVLFPYVLEGKMLCHTLILSSTGCGKTTILRDLIRQISNGNSYISGKNVGVVDERSEIGGCWQGIPQNEIGQRTDILDGCPKAEGMMMLVRSMSPEVIAVDEIGSEEDIKALSYAMHCGVTLLATVHGASLEELQRKALFEKLWKDHWFERYVILKRKDTLNRLEGIFDKWGNAIC